MLAGALSTMVERLEASRVELARAGEPGRHGHHGRRPGPRDPHTAVRAARLGGHAREAIGDDERRRELVSFVEEEIHRLERLVSDLLVFARPRPPELEPTDVADVAGRAAGALAGEAEEAGVVLRTELEPAPVRADEEQLYQVGAEPA